MYKCTYTSGGGTEYSDGIWELKQTPKTKTLIKISEAGVFDMHSAGDKIKVGTGTGNPLKDTGDGTFVVYLMQAGVPYYFEPMEGQCPTKSFCSLRMN